MESSKDEWGVIFIFYHMWFKMKKIEKIQG